MEWITVPEKGFTLREVRTLTNRNVNLSEELEKSVSAILKKVRDGGDAAIRELTKKFDGVELSDFRVTEEEMQEALAQVTPEFLEVLKEAKANIETFHKEQVRKSWTKNFRDGVELGEQFLPIQRVGVYVPGLSVDCTHGYGTGARGGLLFGRDDDTAREGWQGESEYPGGCLCGWRKGDL
jgi:histidinol dehydrogenase